MARRKSKKQVLAVVSAQPQNKNKQRTRRRRRNRNNKSVTRMGMGVPRSRMPLTRDGANFMRAALDPFSDVSLRSVGVPDSFAGDTLKYCNTMEITIQPDSSGNIQFTVLPSASHPLIATKGRFKSVLVPQYNSTTFNFVGTTTVDIDSNNAFSGTGTTAALPWPTWAQLPDAQGQYSLKSQRIVSQGLEWRYTGSELSDQGVCTAAILDAFSIDGYIEKPADPAMKASCSSLKWLNRAEINNLVKNDEVSLSNQPRFVQQTMHSAEGAGGMIVLVSGEDGWVLKPTNSSVAFLSSDLPSAAWTTATSGSAALAGYGVDSQGTPVDVRCNMLPWQNLRPVGVALTGLDPDKGIIVLRLKQRIEATVHVSSAFQQFTDKSPVEDQAAIDLVADLSKTLPVMVPVTMNGFGDWWKKIMGKIGSLGKIVGGMRIPMVSTIAGGVGDIAEILGSFADL